MDYLEPYCNVEVKPSIVTLTAAVEAYSTKERGENRAETSVEFGMRSQEDGKANDTFTFSRGAVDEPDDFEDFYETDKYTLICRISNRFYESIKHIMEQKSIGVAFQGQKLGRDGILSLIQVATDSELIIFDIVRLGNGAFIGGLQTVFESEHIMKVIHDCRWISDLLGHQHGIFIANVFDTQVANAFVYRALNEGNWPKHVESLPACLISHLELPAQDVYHTQFKERYSEENEVVWLVRPLPTELLDAAYEDTIHLLRLQRVLLREMLVEFKAAVQIYLNFSTTAMEDMERCKVIRDLLPIAFTHIHMGIKRTSDHRMDPHTFNRQISQISCVDVPEKVVTFSQHSRLHEDGNLDGQEFSQTQSAAGQQSGAKITRASTDEKKKSRRRKAAKPQHSSQKQRSAKKIAICGDRDISESAGSISPADCSIDMSTDVDCAVASSSMGEDLESFIGEGSVSDVEEFSSGDSICPSSGTDKVQVVSDLVSAPHDKSNIDGQELDASRMPTDIMAPNPSAVSQPLDFSYHKEVTGTLKIQEEKTASILAPCKLHTQEFSYKCNVCQKLFSNSSRASEHKKIHPPYKCRVCETYFVVKSSLMAHEKTHFATSYECDVCHKSFSLKSTLTNHKKTHLSSGEKTHACDVCGKTFFTFAQLKGHQLTHSDIRLHMCEICGNAFKYRGGLRKHLKIHSGVRYQCAQCDRSYQTKAGLRDHEINHTGLRPYTCDVCDKSFLQKGTLRGHMLTHTGIKSHKCEVCGKSFVRKSQLSIHYKRIHSKEKQYHCDQCEKCFAIEFDLTHHKKQVHLRRS